LYTDAAFLEPESFEKWNAKQYGNPEEIGFLQALRIAYCSGQDSVYEAAAQRQWGGLTDDEKLELISDAKGIGGRVRSDAQLLVLLDMQEAKLKEKNT